MTKKLKPPALTADEQRCLEWLEDWRRKIVDLLSFIGSATHVARDRQDPESETWTTEAQTRLDALKRGLLLEAERLERHDLTEAESNYYARPIQQVTAYLTLDSRSSSGEEWRYQLGSALVTIEVSVSRLIARHTASNS